MIQVLEDKLSIQMVLQRVYLAAATITLAYREQRGEFQILALEADHLAANLARLDISTWKLTPGEKIAVSMEDRGFNYETVVECLGMEDVDGLPCVRISVPRTLRRADGHRLAEFAPDTALAATFCNSRSALVDAHVKGFGADGLELALRDPRQHIQDVLRMGEESTIEVPLDNNLRLLAPTRVAYFGDTYVGLKFTEQADNALLCQYRSWLAHQQRIQAQNDRESFEAETGNKPRKKPMELPQARLLVDRDPLLLVITENDDFAKRLAEGLGRKFGILALDYIKGSVRSFLAAGGGKQGNWGRVRMVLVHNQLRLASPLELTRQIVEHEKCTLPVLMAGTDEDIELKQNRAIAAGAVDYLVVEPFRILQVLRKVDETLRMFEGA